MGLDTYTRGVDVCWGACTSGRHACCSVVCSSSVQLSEHWILLLGTWHAWKRTYPKLLMHCMLQSSDRIVFFKDTRSTLCEELLSINPIIYYLLPDPGVEAPLNRAFGRKSKPVFLMDLRFLFENPKL